MPEQEPAPNQNISKPAEMAAADLQPEPGRQSMPAAPAAGVAAGDKVQTAEPDLLSSSSSNASVIDPRTIPVAAASEESSPAIELSAPVHQENEVEAAATPRSVPVASSAKPTATAEPVSASPTAAPEPLPATPTATAEPAPASPTPTADPLPASPGAGDELPPLPVDLGRPIAAAPVVDRSMAQPAVTDATNPAAPSDDELPLLPSDLGRSVRGHSRIDAGASGERE